MKKLALFGGTFNPIHNGHIRLLTLADEALHFDKIIVMPSKIPPHKKAPNLASEQDRLNMCRLALPEARSQEARGKKIGSAQISDFEMKNEGRSYSVITLRHLHEEYPDYRIYFIMGSDMLLSFEEWYCWEEILSLSALVCVSRKAEDSVRLDEYAQRLRAEGGEVILLHDKPFEISSTELREMIKNRELTRLSEYLPENVLEYITDNNLYA